MKNSRCSCVLSYSGSLIAFHIGSGFSSGQEILQFYTCYGFTGGILVGVLTFFLQSIFSACVMRAGGSGGQIDQRQQYLQLAGKRVGQLFYLLTPLFTFAVLTVTFSGAGQAISSLFGIPVVRAKLIFAVPVLLTVLIGFRWVTVISGSIGPIILCCVLLLSGYGFVAGVPTGLWRQLSHVLPNWWCSAICYAGFGAVTQVPFLLTVGQKINDPSAERWIAFLSSGGFVLAGTLLHCGLFRTLPVTIGEQMPALKLAARLSGFFCWFYGITVLFSIFSTAVPLLWTLCHTVQREENRPGYRLTCGLVTAFLVLQNRFSFEKLLSWLYPYIGLISCVLFGAALVRRLGRGAKKHSDEKQKTASSSKKRF